MKNLIIAIVVVLLSIASATAHSDSITIKKNILGPIYMRNGKSLSLKKMERLMRKDSDAQFLFWKGKNAHTTSFWLAFVGGWFIGGEIGKASVNKEVNPAIVGAGAALIGLSIPFSISAQKKFKRAIEYYNSGYRKTSVTHFKPDVYLTFSGNSAGIRVNF